MAGTVDARVLNLAGRPVRALCSGRACEAGANTLLWSATSDGGLAAPDGLYLVEVAVGAPDGTQSRAMAQVRIAR